MIEFKLILYLSFLRTKVLFSSLCYNAQSVLLWLYPLGEKNVSVCVHKSKCNIRLFTWTLYWKPKRRQWKMSVSLLSLSLSHNLLLGSLKLPLGWTPCSQNLMKTSTLTTFTMKQELGKKNYFCVNMHRIRVKAYWFFQAAYSNLYDWGGGNQLCPVFLVTSGSWQDKCIELYGKPNRKAKTESQTAKHVYQWVSHLALVQCKEESKTIRIIWSDECGAQQCPRRWFLPPFPRKK